MSLRDFYNKVKKVFGRAAETDQPAPACAPQRTSDIGPAKQWYIRHLFPRSIFTKKMSHAREVEIRKVFRTLRDEQRAIAIRHGYDKGLKL